MRGLMILVVLSVLTVIACVYLVSAARRNAGWKAFVGRAFTAPEERGRTWVLLGLAVALTAAAVVVGINDNPPGLLCAFAAVAAAALAVVHPLRWARPYEILLLTGCVGLVGGAVLHNLFDAAAHGIPLLGIPLQVLSVAFFLLAVLVSPSLIVVGGVGALYFHVKSEWQRRVGV